MKVASRRTGGIKDNLDRNLAILGMLIASILTLWLALVIGKYIEVGVLLFLACAIYLAMRKRLFRMGISSLEDLLAKRSAYLILNLLFFVLFFYSIISVVLRADLYSRPLGYFISMAFMAAILAIEILFLPKGKAYTCFVLVKIMLIALSLRWTTQFIFPGLIGVDPWGHQMFATQIMETGTIPGGYPYSYLPIMHLTIDATSLITGLDYKFATMLSISLFQVIGLIFVFLLGRFIFNSKVGLLAALLPGVAELCIGHGIAVSPTPLALVLIALVIYVIFKAQKGGALILTSLALLLMAVVILTHSITALCLAIVLFVFWLGFIAYKRIYLGRFQSPVTFYLAVLFTVGMLAWWTYASGHISNFVELMQWGFKVERWELAEPAFEYQQTVPFSEYLLNLMGFLLFYAFSFVGSFYMLAKRFGNRYGCALVLGGLVLAAIGFIALPLGLSGFLAHRWWYYSYIILAIPAAIGFLSVCAYFRSNLGRTMILAILILVISFFSITAPRANFDNRIYSENTASRSAFTESELSAMNTISNIWDGEVGVATSSADYYLEFNKDMLVKQIAPNLYSRDFTDCAYTIVIIRDEVVNNYFAFSGGGMKLDYDPREVLEEQGFSTIYDCGRVNAFLLK